MRVKHPEPVKVECQTYACTLDRDDHEEVDDPNFDHDPGDVWHYDETTGVWWPARDERFAAHSIGSGDDHD